jgi:hypothetical protein
MNMATTGESRVEMIGLGDDKTVFLDYTNYRGERRWRKARPIRLWYGVTGLHPRPQWFLDALDLEKGAERTFALCDLHRWTDVAPKESEDRP